MKNIGILIVILFSFSYSNAQFQFDIGLGLASSGIRTQNFMRPVTLIGTNIKDTNYYSYNVSAGGYGVHLYPKYHLKQVGNHTLSLGAPLFFGFAGSPNSTQGSTLAYIYDLNLAVDINGGRLNRQQDYPDKMVGYYAGLGFGVMNTNGIRYSGGLNNSLNQNTKGILFVPEGGYDADFMVVKTSSIIFHGGVVAPFKFDKDDTKSMGIRFFVKPGLRNNQLTYYGFSLYITFSNDRGY